MYVRERESSVPVLTYLLNCYSYLLYSAPKPSQLTRYSSTLAPVPPIEKRSPSSSRTRGVRVRVGARAKVRVRATTRVRVIG